jgi:uncharacterized membrane protein YfcA
VIDGSPLQLVLLLIAGLLAGAVNAVAGGGSLIVFPALLAVGFAPLPANVTNSVAQWPGYLGAILGQRDDLHGQRRRVLGASVAGVLGSAVGCGLLLVLPDAVFDAVVPALVLLASVLLAAQPWISRRVGEPAPGAPDNRAALLVSIFLGAIYGGYFGGALGVIMIAMLALFAHDTLVRLNAVKVVLSLVISTVTVVIFGLFAPVDWLAVAVIAPSTLVGGYLGGRLVRRLPDAVLRWSVVTLGVAVAVYLFLRL